MTRVQPSRAEHRHAEGAAFGIEREPALARSPQSRAEFDPRVDEPAAHAAPLRAGVGDDPERRGGGALPRGDEERERAGRRAAGRGRGLGQVRALDAQQRDVGRRIAAHKLGPGRGAVVGDDLDFPVVGERILRRDDEPRPPDESRSIGHAATSRKRRSAPRRGQAPRRRRRRRSRAKGLDVSDIMALLSALRCRQDRAPSPSPDGRDGCRRHLQPWEGAGTSCHRFPSRTRDE